MLSSSPYTQLAICISKAVIVSQIIYYRYKDLSDIIILPV